MSTYNMLCLVPHVPTQILRTLGYQVSVQCILCKWNDVCNVISFCWICFCHPGGFDSQFSSLSAWSLPRAQPYHQQIASIATIVKTFMHFFKTTYSKFKLFLSVCVFLGNQPTTFAIRYKIHKRYYTTGKNRQRNFKTFMQQNLF